MKRILIATFGLLTLGAGSAAAQCVGSCSVTTDIAVTIPAMLKIGLSGSFVFDAPTAADVEAAATLASTGGPTLDTKGNVPYKVDVSATAFVKSAPVNAGDASGYTKPLSDVSVQVGANPAVPLATLAAELYTLGRGSSSDAVSGTFKLNADDAAATYTTTVTFTIGAQ